MEIVIIGIGGIGYPLSDFVSRTMMEQDRLILVDGDILEERNLDRQGDPFSVGRRKASSRANVLGEIYPSKRIVAIDKYIDGDDHALFNNKIEESDKIVFFACVDNHKSRKIIQDLVAVAEMPNVLLISGGNELYTGDVLVFEKRGGEIILPRIDTFHGEINEEGEGPVGGGHCRRNQAEQVLATNLMVAATMFAVYTIWREGKPLAHEYNLDIRGPVLLRKERRE